MWELNRDYLNVRQIKRYAKLHRTELASCGDRIEEVIGLLNKGVSFADIRAGFIHNEGQGLFAVGNVRTPSARESRLYFYLYFSGEELYLLGIGDKDSQQRDIAAHRRTINRIRIDIQRKRTHGEE